MHHTPDRISPKKPHHNCRSRNQPQPQPLYMPAPLMQLTGGMKFGWFVVGALMGIPGIVISWLVNVDKLPQVKSEALKWTIIGFVVWIVLGILISLAIGGIKCRFDAPPSVFRLIRFIELKETTWITAPRQGSSPASAR